MFTQTGSCPKCGAAIFVPSLWHGVIPPPPTFTCSCTPSKVVKYSTVNTTTADLELKTTTENNVLQAVIKVLEELSKKQADMEGRLRELVGEIDGGKRKVLKD